MSNESQNAEIVGVSYSPQPTGNPKIIFLKPIELTYTITHKI